MSRLTTLRRRCRDSKKETAYRQRFSCLHTVSFYEFFFNVTQLKVPTYVLSAALLL